MNTTLIKNNLKYLREKAEMSQTDLADTLGLSRQSISKWENGTSVPSVELLYEMSKIYGISINDIIELQTDEIMAKPLQVNDISEYIPCPKCSNRMNVDKFDLAYPEEFDFIRKEGRDNKTASAFNISFKKFKLTSGNIVQGKLSNIYSCGYCGNVLCTFDTKI